MTGTSRGEGRDNQHDMTRRQTRASRPDHDDDDTRRDQARTVHTTRATAGREGPRKKRTRKETVGAESGGAHPDGTTPGVRSGARTRGCSRPTTTGDGRNSSAGGRVRRPRYKQTQARWHRGPPPPQRQSTTGGKGGLGGREGADSEIMWARGARAEPRCYVEHYAGCTAVAPRRLSTSVWRVDACPDGAAPECASVRACECVWRRRATRRGGSRAGGRADPRPSICRVVPAAPVLRWESVPCYL